MNKALATTVLASFGFAPAAQEPVLLDRDPSHRTRKSPAWGVESDGKALVVRQEVRLAPDDTRFDHQQKIEQRTELLVVQSRLAVNGAPIPRLHSGKSGVLAEVAVDGSPVHFSLQDQILGAVAWHIDTFEKAVQGGTALGQAIGDYLAASSKKERGRFVAIPHLDLTPGNCLWVPDAGVYLIDGAATRFAEFFSELKVVLEDFSKPSSGASFSSRPLFRTFALNVLDSFGAVMVRHEVPLSPIVAGCYMTYAGVDKSL